MAETAARVAVVARRSSGEIHKYSGKPESPDFMIFGYLEENEEFSESSCNSVEGFGCENFLDEDDEDESSCDIEKNKVFWETQEQLLEAILRRSSSVESKIKQATKQALRVLISEGGGCICRGSAAAEGCRNCIQREISGRLQRAGYDCSICISKWKSSTDIPSGEHTYLEVTDNSNSKRGEMRVVIELSFRAEFEMARGSDEYNRLVRRLPEVFVGKSERLRALIKLLCSAAKKCMKEKKMHMAPWRKHKYMEAKWLGKKIQMAPSPVLAIKDTQLERPHKQRASMLTFDLLETLPTLRRAAIRVV
ncbi:hypothetical protein NMG60_11035599 [Bertholletia excelsa]